MRAIVDTLKNLLMVSLPTLIICAVILEMGVRILLPISSPKPLSEFDDASQLLRFKPNQSGTTIRYEINAKYHINAQGWNSAVDYQTEKAPGEIRIAVIGDSYIEAQQVDYDRNLAAVLQQTLNNDSTNPVTVYSFGISGAPLSQYLHMMRYVSATYHPDITIITIIHNDFQESFRAISAKPHHLQFDVNSRGELVELPIISFKPSFAQRGLRVLAASALFRYIWFNLDYGRRLFSSQTVTDPTVTLNPGIDLNRLVTETVFGEFRDLSTESGSHLLLVIDAPRDYIYDGRPPEDSPQYRYNVISADTARQLGIPFLDLTPVFAADYAANGKSFSFESDYHWNSYGHELVGKVLAASLIEHGWVTQP